MSNEGFGPAPTSYVATHCRNCKAGWTRTGEKGGKLTICLLDREKVMEGMADCDRYELRDQKELG